MAPKGCSDVPLPPCPATLPPQSCTWLPPPWVPLPQFPVCLMLPHEEHCWCPWGWPRSLGGHQERLLCPRAEAAPGLGWASPRELSAGPCSRDPAHSVPLCTTFSPAPPLLCQVSPLSPATPMAWQCPLFPPWDVRPAPTPEPAVTAECHLLTVVPSRDTRAAAPRPSRTKAGGRR